MKNNVIVRFPPSPTGPMHIGNIRTFLFNYLFAKRNNGKIVMRFEDTDKQRSKKEYETQILETLDKLSLHFDEGPYRQSDRVSVYKSKIEELIDRGFAYEAEENSQKTGRVIRFKNPNKEIVFNDIIRGEIKIDTTSFGDFVIARSINDPLYHLCVVVDDIESKITHIIRGEDHITSTPRQILLFEAFKAKIPEYAHLPLIVGDDKKKLSKRHGATSFEEFEKQGILPFALVNYLALLGWSPGNDKELFDSMDEIIKYFDLSKVSPSPAMFDYKKLYAINKYHLSKLDKEEVFNAIENWMSNEYLSFIKTLNDEQKEIMFSLILERIQKYSDIDSVLKSDFPWIFDTGEYKAYDLIWKKANKEETLKHLQFVFDLLSFVDDSEYKKDLLEEKIKSYANEHGMGNVLWPLRYALTGYKKSPDPFSVMIILGKDKSSERLKIAIDKLCSL